jgi:predicted nucleic acid-binding protein
MPPTVIRDPADDQVLACALAARADLIVSGDEHLLSLGSFREIPIVGSSAAVARIASATEQP